MNADIKDITYFDVALNGVKILVKVKIPIKGHPKTAGGISIYVPRCNDCKIVLSNLQ